MQKKLVTLSFQERERQREIDHHNKLLLGQLLKIEKDMQKHKRLKKGIRASLSPASNHLKEASNWTSTQAVSSQMSAAHRPEFHASKNLKANMKAIDMENSRLYN